MVHAVTPKGIGDHSVVVGLTAEECRQLSERHLIAARALLETIKPKTDMELIIIKATCDLLIETATALLQGERHELQTKTG